MRLRVSESIIIPFVTRDAAGLVTLHINAHSSFDEIELLTTGELTPTEVNQAELLWADDATNRVFTPIDSTTDFYIEFRPHDE